MEEGDVAPDKEHPLAGVILCCTSVLQEHREELAAVATQMGAVHKFDLTSDVTHLIVGELNTPKYRYVAKERTDIKVLKAEWVEAVRSSWMLGGDTNLQELEEQYRYPTFAGLSICLTGFDDMSYRNQLQQTITDNGAEFRRDLTKSVTHLIARSGTGQKYKYATMWKIKVVSIKWLQDSLERGMALDESLYDPRISEEEQGIGAWNRHPPPAQLKRPKPANTKVQRPRKLRRVASVKLGNQNEDIWTDIVGDAAKPSGSNLSFQTEPGERVTEMAAAANPPNIVQEPKSFASETTMAEKPRPAMGETPTQESQALVNPRRGFWYGARFFMKGFSSSQTKILETHLLSRDAQIVSSLESLVRDTPTNQGGNYILVPHNLPRSELPSTDEFEDELEFVTDLWIEKCLHNNTLVPPEAHITSTPFPRFPIPAFQELRICSTGFGGIDLLHLSKLVKVMGATYDEYFTPKASVLICYNTTPSNQEKLRHAAEWKIPSVVADWLWISVQTGERKPFTPYLIQNRLPQNNRPPTHALRKIDSKKRSAPSETNIPAPSDSDITQPTQITGGKKDETQPALSREPGFAAGSALQELSTNSPRKASRSPSPSKRNKSPTPTLPVRSKSSTETTNNNRDPDPDPKTTLDNAINEFLKAKRQAASAKPSSLDDKDGSNSGSGAHQQQQQQQQQRRKCRKQLFGRANSHSSTLLGAAVPGGGGTRMSRASSIDTMNEDGYGSVVDGLGLDDASTASKLHSNAPSFSSLLGANKRTDKTEAQQLLESRLDMFRAHAAGGGDAAGYEEDGGDDVPAMTQLGYEDADAAAMRAKITYGSAGARADDAAPATGQNERLVLDGWGSRRRTRRSGRGVVHEGL